MKNIGSIIKDYRIDKILLLIVSLAVGSIALGWIVQHNDLIKMFDKYFYVLISKMPHTDLMNTIVWPFDLWFLHIGNFTHMPAYFYVFLGIFLLYILIRRRNMFVWMVIAFILGAYFAGLLLAFDWHFIFRNRPYLYLPNDHLPEATKKALTKWPSFPSGHTRDTTMFATIIAYFAPETKIPMILFSFFIGFTRVYTGAHWPTDSIGGLILGFGLGILTIWVVEDFQKLSQYLALKGHASSKKKK